MTCYEIVQRDTDLSELKLFCHAAQILGLSIEDAYGETNPYRTVLRNLAPAFFPEPWKGCVPAARASVAYLWNRADLFDERGY